MMNVQHSPIFDLGILRFYEILQLSPVRDWNDIVVVLHLHHCPAVAVLQPTYTCTCI